MCKKIINLLIILNLIAGNLVSNAFSENDISKERKEIIVKYFNEDEFSTFNAKNSILKKVNPQKFNRKKLIFSSDAKYEIIEIGKDDNTRSIADRLSKEPGVEFAVPNHRITIKRSKITLPKDPYFDLQWGLNNTGQTINDQVGKNGIDINTLKAWNITKGSSKVIIGVLDTGIDINHEDLAKNIFSNNLETSFGKGRDEDSNGFIDDINGWDFYNNDNSVYDSSLTDEHGTYVAGIIGANRNNLGICGVAPNVTILPLKFIGEEGGYVSDVIEAIQYGKKMGVKIFNCSWSMSEYNVALENEIKNTDAVFICAAGNSGNNIETTPVYPACFKSSNIISVAAVDNRGELAIFSNYGKKVDLAAPGVGIISTIPENLYMMTDGTSASAPFVSGVAGLLQSKYPNFQTKDIIRKIRTSTTTLKSLFGKISSNGLIDASKCIR